MIFTFEHMNIDRVPGSVNRKWALKPFDLRESETGYVRLAEQAGMGRGLECSVLRKP